MFDNKVFASGNNSVVSGNVRFARWAFIRPPVEIKAILQSPMNYPVPPLSRNGGFHEPQ